MTIQVSTPETVDASMAPIAEKVQDNPSAPEAKATEQKESSESDTDEKEAKEDLETVDESKDESDAEEGADDSKDSENAKPKKKGGFQRRIDKLSAAKADALRELEYWKSEALKEKTAKEPKSEPVETKKPDDSDKPNPDTFDTHTEYVEALTDWKIEQKAKAKEEEANKSKILNDQDALFKAHTDRVSSFKEKTADFDDVLVEVDDIPVSPAVQELILTSENGPELMYALAKDRKEYERICKLPPLAAARAIGNIEQKLASNQPNKAEEKPETKKTTKAPNPIGPVGTGGKASTANAKSIFDPDLPQAEYERIRREQIKRKAG